MIERLLFVWDRALSRGQSWEDRPRGGHADTFGERAARYQERILICGLFALRVESTVLFRDTLGRVCRCLLNRLLTRPAANFSTDNLPGNWRKARTVADEKSASNNLA